MKRALQYLLLSLLLVGCSPTDMDYKLNEIESLMDSSPELALSALDSIAPTQLKHDSQKALFALLYSQALDKNYIDETNDSLIRVAVRHFDKSDDLYHKMLSHYYHGRVYYNAKDFPRSLSSMTKAYNASEDIADHYWKGRIAEQIANIYDANFHGEDAIFYANIAFENLQKSRRQPYINYCLLNLARTYNNHDKCADAIKYTKQLIDSAQLYNDSILLSIAHELLAVAYFGANDYKSAVAIFTSIRAQKPLKNNLLSLYGLSHLILGNNEEAFAAFDEMQQYSTKENLSLTYEIAKRIGDTETALSVLTRIYNKLDSVFAESKKRNFGQALNEVYTEERQINESTLRQERLSRRISVAVGLILIFVIIITFIYCLKQYNKKLQKNILIAQNIQEILQIKETGLSEANDTIRTLISARFEIIDKLCKTVYENQATGLVKKKLSAEIEMLIEQMSSDHKKIYELEEIVNTNCSNLINSFKNDLPDLKNADYLLFLYTTLGFSTNAIALFLKEDKLEPVYNRKARLKNKIKKLNPEKASKYLSYIS